MKALILVASIFYILGLKISHKIDLIKSSSREKTISIQKAAPLKTEKAINFKEAEALKSTKDSVASFGTSTDEVLQYK